ncbi:hypothetical protein SPV1_12440 [Mariprofundus ferrooxydans PV-1]|uniref:Uncharacterized protein n=1 Tax=Mariprofundus ferrooxydans PV-1 TaxID=314345 RepID=Q0EWL4_9PROT|nr:hypothetical protein SPV1_12440 [Mariprofundus ferrooxydans PV-1]
MEDGGKSLRSSGLRPAGYRVIIGA